MSLSNELRAKISQYANLRSWFAFKDYIVGSTIDADLKAAIISYGTELMMTKYHSVLP